MIKDITEFIFVEHELQQADIIFIPGSCFKEPSIKAAELWKRGYADYLLPAGKYSVLLDKFCLPKELAAQYPKPYETECEYMCDILKQHGVSNEKILHEVESMNTFENAFKSRRVTDQLAIEVKTAIVCTQAFHARRCLMYYQWAYPEAKIIICPTETQQINKENWFMHSFGIKRVMGELMRCGTQFIDAIPDYYRQLNGEI